MYLKWHVLKEKKKYDMLCLYMYIQRICVTIRPIISWAIYDQVT